MLIIVLLELIQAISITQCSLYMYTLGFLLKETDGNATYTAQPKIIGGQSIDIRYRPFMVKYFLTVGRHT